MKSAYKVHLIIAIFCLPAFLTAQPIQNVFLDTIFGAADNKSLSGFDGTVNALAIHPKTRILVGGEFKKCNGISVNGFVALTLDGKIDTAFPTGGFRFKDYPQNTVIKKIWALKTGKILVHGIFSQYFDRDVNRLTRLNSDGSLDTTFTCYIHQCDAIQELDDGKVFVATTAGLVKLNADGSEDKTFRRHWVYVNDFVIQPDGKIIIGGDFREIQFHTRGNIARLFPNGELDHSFKGKYYPGYGCALLPWSDGTGTDWDVFSLDLDNKGRIIVGGVLTAVNGYPAPRFGRFNSDGTTDTSFNPTVRWGVEFDHVDQISVLPTGKIQLLGYFHKRYGFPGDFIGRYNEDGTHDTTFIVGDGFNNITTCSVDLDDGSILVGGAFTTFNGKQVNKLAKLNVMYRSAMVQQKLLALEQFKVFPNPVNDELLIQIPQSDGAAIKIINLDGRTVLSEKYDSGTALIDISVSNLPSGIYFLSINTGETLDTRKIMIE